ncbi:MAG: hypothetical protein K0B14_12130 [Anaerolineaceae bacterium]|nr:hypothetical protein [Anaerolineaceae bacterium]
MSIVNGHFDYTSVVYCYGASNSPQLMLDSVVIKDNSSLAYGGGIHIDSCDVSINQSTLVNNNSSEYGGAIYAYESNIEITQSNILDNEAKTGGGIFNQDSIITLQNSSISGNIANHSSGGGIFQTTENSMLVIEDSLISENFSNEDGGGIAAISGRSLTIMNSTISGNSANANGGGVFSRAVTTISHSTIVKNIADADMDDVGNGGGLFSSQDGEVKIEQSILADNFEFNSLQLNHDCGLEYSGSVISSGYNLVGSVGNCEFLAVGDITGVDPKLTPLGDYGGNTFTHAFLFGSPAIDAGTNTDCLAFDQRGNSRPVDGDGDGVAICDIGAYESDRLWGVFLPLITR